MKNLTKISNQSKSNASHPQGRKISFKSFMKTVWQFSQTNLHYTDFTNLFEDDLKQMFKPINIEKHNTEIEKDRELVEQARKAWQNGELE